MKIVYGYTAEPFKNDVLVDIAGDAMDKFARAGVPGAFMVDMMPFCECLLRTSATLRSCPQTDQY